VENSEGMKLYQQERVILEATERICEAMEEQGFTRKELADALGTSKSFISQLLDGSRNMTLRTLSDVFLALGLAVHVDAGSIEATIRSSVTLTIDGEANWSPQQAPWSISPDDDSVTTMHDGIAA
jgi:transcriptional regulator with XRE-family HTH domain